jgi:type II secretion system protein G
MFKSKFNNFLNGFTLVELLVVIAIIGLLSTIVLVSTSGVRDSAKIAKTQQELAAFRQALSNYWSVNGNFPCLNEGAVSSCLLGALSSYANLPTLDPWGNAYQWHNPGCCVTECTMVLSAGPNGVMCKGTGNEGGVGCEHIPSQTSGCIKPYVSDDDVGIYFGQVQDNQ